MRLAVLTATSAAFLMCSPLTIADSDSPEGEPYVTGDNTLSLKLRSYYQDRQLKDFKNKTYKDLNTGDTVKNHQKQKALGQGLEVNFESAFLGTETAGIGFDFSLYGGLKILGEKDRFGTTILKQEPAVYDKNQQKYLADQDSYAKVGLANIKAFAGDDDSNVHARVGWMNINKPLLQTYYRLTPTTFQGVSVDAKLGDFELYGVRTDKVSLYNHDKMEDFTSSKPGKDGRNHKDTKIDYIYTLGGSYNHESGFGSDLAYAESDSYLKLYHARLNYTFSLDEQTSLLLEGQFYKGEENGDKWRNNNTTYGGFDKDANLYNFNAMLNYDMFTFSASYSKVNAKKENGLGFFDYHLAYESGNDYDNLGYTTKRQLSDFNYNGENVWQAGAQYHFDNLGAPGLTLGYTFTQGSDIETTNLKDYSGKYKETEHNFSLGYAFQQKELKGLNVTLLYAQHKGDKEISKIKNPEKEGYEYEGMSDLRLYVDYTVSVF